MEYTDGTLKYKVINFANQSGGGVIHGMITAFSGTFDSNGYPIDKATGTSDTAWHLCDGTNGTPDLRGRFILGASDSHPVGSTGGEEAHILTCDEGFPHNHLTRVYTDNNEVAKMATEGVRLHEPQWLPAGNTTAGSSGGDLCGVTEMAGGGKPHNNMPPYYALSYIMFIG